MQCKYPNFTWDKVIAALDFLLKCFLSFFSGVDKFSTNVIWHRFTVQRMIFHRFQCCSQDLIRQKKSPGKTTTLQNNRLSISISIIGDYLHCHWTSFLWLQQKGSLGNEILFHQRFGITPVHHSPLKYLVEFPFLPRISNEFLILMSREVKRSK